MVEHYECFKGCVCDGISPLLDFAEDLGCKVPNCKNFWHSYRCMPPTTFRCSRSDTNCMCASYFEVQEENDLRGSAISDSEVFDLKPDSE